MTGIMLDTDTLSAIRQPNRNPAFADWLRGQDQDQFYISTVSVMEILAGIAKKDRSDPSQAMVLRLWFDAIVLALGSRVLPFDSSAARLAGAIAAIRTRGTADTQIAATAISHGLSLATRNIKDFEDIPGLAIIAPWAAPGS